MKRLCSKAQEAEDGRGGPQRMSRGIAKGRQIYIEV
jgi:hypothetical protein